MDPLHARYPFLPEAREAVEAADADLAEVVREDGAVVERATERVEEAIEARTVGDPHRSNRVELLSYPVARVLVSLLDQPALTDRYADAEGPGELRSVSARELSREAFLEAIDLAGAVERTERGFDVDVPTYLQLSGDLRGDAWRLASRALAAGRVPVTEAELADLLHEAVRHRVAADLPLSVPDGIAGAISGPVAGLESLLSDFSGDRSIDAVEPALFPPCVKALAERVEAGEPMAPHSAFAYVSFLAAIGMDAGDVESRLESHPDAALAGYRVDHLTDRAGAAYLPPSCATMVAYGDCVNKDDLCARIGHPLEYYERRLDGAVPGQASRAESQ